MGYGIPLWLTLGKEFLVYNYGNKPTIAYFAEFQLDLFVQMAKPVKDSNLKPLNKLIMTMIILKSIPAAV